MTTRRTFIIGALAGLLGGFLAKVRFQHDGTNPHWLRSLSPNTVEFRSLSLVLPDILLGGGKKTQMLASLEAKLGESLPSSVTLDSLSRRQIKEILSDTIRRDYQSGSTVEVHGWVLSRTEQIVLNLHAKN